MNSLPVYINYYAITLIYTKYNRKFAKLIFFLNSFFPLYTADTICHLCYNNNYLQISKNGHTPTI